MPRTLEIPEGWELKLLEEVTEVIMGQSPPGYSYNHVGKGIPLINGPVEFGDRYPSKLQWTTLPTKFCESNDILFCVRGSTTGRMNISNDVFCIGRGVAAIRGRRDIAITSFIELCLRQLAEAILSEARGSGSTFPSISSKRLAKTAVLLPPLHEQRRIVEVLDTIDSTIAHTSALIAKLKQMKAGLLHDLLTRGLDENGELRDAIAHPEQFKDSPLGQIPKNWEICPIENKLEKIIDYRGRTPEKKNAGVPLITAKNVREGFIDIEPREFIDEADYERWMTRGIPTVEDVLFTTEAPLGNVAFVPNYKIALAQRLLTLCPNPAQLETKFLLWLMLLPASQRRLEQKSTGSTVLGIKQSVFRKVIFQFPSLKEQRLIANALDAQEDLIKREEVYLSKLKEQKKGLMHDLLTGRVRVTDLKEIPA